MDQDLIQIFILALVAGFILFRLYTTLGRRTGAERPTEPRPAPAPVPGAALPQEPTPQAPIAGAAPSGPASQGLMAIVRADPSFDSEHFATGARGAYEMIVNAFAKADREALNGLLTPRVFNSYMGALKAREEKGEEGPELVRLKSAEIIDADLQGDTARVTVRFEAELAEGAYGVRDTREKWTFERDIRSGDPNWLLARVAAA